MTKTFQVNSQRKEEMCQRRTLFPLQEERTHGLGLPGLAEPPKKPWVQHAHKEEKLPKLKEIKDNNKKDKIDQVSFRLDKDF